MGSRYDLSFCAFITTSLAPELVVSMGPCLHLWFLLAKQRLLDQNYKSLLVPDLTCSCVHAKQCDLHQNDKPIWVPALICEFQVWPVVLCIHNNVISTWISSLYGSLPSSVVFACKTATFGPELQVSIGPRPHLPLCACKTVRFASEWQTYMGSSPHLWFCAFKTATLGSD